MTLPLIQTALLDAVPGVVHGFTTAEDGAGGGFDLGTGADAAAWQRVCTALGAPDAAVARAHQVHGSDVAVVGAGGDAGVADALVTATPGVLVAVRTADCVPILVAGPGGVAAIHAGWRGLAAQVIGAGVAALRGRVGTGRLVAAVGPCIGVERYEVGGEVVAGIGAVVPRSVFVVERSPRPHVDLRAAAAWQLRQAGVHQIDVLPHCTYDDPRLHSHRERGAAAGRLAGVIGMLPPGARP